jgi:hypothetical protein
MSETAPRVFIPAAEALVRWSNTNGTFEPVEGLGGGRCWTRTSDPRHVRPVLCQLS